jgi:hypothetical protein
MRFAGTAQRRTRRFFTRSEKRQPLHERHQNDPTSAGLAAIEYRHYEPWLDPLKTALGSFADLQTDRGAKVSAREGVTR